MFSIAEINWKMNAKCKKRRTILKVQRILINQLNYFITIEIDMILYILS